MLAASGPCTPEGDLPLALLTLRLLFPAGEGPFGGDSEFYFCLGGLPKALPECSQGARLVCRDAVGQLWLTPKAKRVHGEPHRCTPHGVGDPDLVAWEEVTYVKSDRGRCRFDDERTIVTCAPREKWQKLDRQFN